ncbi:MAG: EAL domain-containing protein, partial [Erysipelotrichaceae bacterium]|nr:EAL domain-containing protein [Erysipelotrichaceae bacterium]
FDLAKSHLLRLKRLGFIIALDDFGAGYSSLSYLHLLPIDCMNIDRTFSINPGVNNNQDLILQAIINLAQKLHLKVVAEGIETNVQKDFFLEMECILGQGYLFAFPEAEALATQRIEESIEKAKH